MLVPVIAVVVVVVVVVVAIVVNRRWTRRRAAWPMATSHFVAGSAELDTVLRADFVTSSGIFVPGQITNVRASAIADPPSWFVVDAFSSVHDPTRVCEVAAEAMHDALRRPARDAATRIEHAFAASNAAVRKLDPSGKSGTSALALAYTDTGFVVGHIGAARLYQLRRGALTSATIDHSIINDFIKMRGLTGDEAAKIRAEAPHRRAVVRAIGVADTVAPELTRLAVQPDDLFAVVTQEIALRFDARPQLLEVLADATDAMLLASAIDRSSDRLNEAIIAIALVRTGAPTSIPRAHVHQP